jgi:hypothetical protein
MRIRHYGLLANRRKQELLQRCRQLLGACVPEPPTEKTTAQWLLLLLSLDITRCPRCGHAPLKRTKLPPLWLQLHAASRPSTSPPTPDDSS